MLAVQNTYLETFQSLGALGLLLGTLGLATVQFRSVLERRQELALMRAAGFRRGRLAKMVMSKKPARARSRLQEIVDKAPDSPAAQEAARLLKEIK